MNIKAKLEKILNSPRLEEKSKPFVSSLLEQAKKRDLSEKQLTYVDKFYDSCFPDTSVIQAEKDWEDSFSEEMRENINIIGTYYEVFYPSSRVAKNYKDPSWVPSKELYEKSVNSAYAQKTIGNYKAVPKFAIGETIMLRNTQRNRSMYGSVLVPGETLLVVDCHKEAKNNYSLRYKVVSVAKMEDQRIIEVSEDALNFYKPSKDKE